VGLTEDQKRANVANLLERAKK